MLGTEGEAIPSGTKPGSANDTFDPRTLLASPHSCPPKANLLCREDGVHFLFPIPSP